MEYAQAGKAVKNLHKELRDIIGFDVQEMYELLDFKEEVRTTGKRKKALSTPPGELWLLTLMMTRPR